DQVGGGPLERTVEGDDRDAQVPQFADAAVRVGRGQHDAADPLVGQHGQAGRLPGAVLVGVADQDPVAPGQRDDLDDPDHFGEVRVLDVRDDDAQRLHMLAAQVPGQPVRPVAQIGHGGADPAAQLRIDLGVPVEDPGHGGHGHLGPFGDVFDPYGARAFRRRHG